MARSTNNPGLTNTIAFRTLMFNPCCLRLHGLAAAPAADPRKRDSPTKTAQPRESPHTCGGRTLSRDLSPIAPRCSPEPARQRAPASVRSLWPKWGPDRPSSLAGGAGPETQRWIPDRTRPSTNDGTRRPPSQRENGPPNHAPLKEEVHGSARRLVNKRSPEHSGHPRTERMVRITTHHSKRTCMGRPGACNTTAVVLVDVLRCAPQSAKQQHTPHR